MRKKSDIIADYKTCLKMTVAHGQRRYFTRGVTYGLGTALGLTFEQIEDDINEMTNTDYCSRLINGELQCQQPPLEFMPDNEYQATDMTEPEHRRQYRIIEHGRH